MYFLLECFYLEFGKCFLNKTGIKCKKCNDEIYSYHRHDFKWCKCGEVAVDGGDDYLKVCGDPGNFEYVEKEVEDKVAKGNRD